MVDVGRAQNLSGVRFGRLTALHRVGSGPDGSSSWRCRCDCGVEKIFRAGNLRSGKTLSCGCLKRDRLVAQSVTHGGARVGKHEPEFDIWQSMKGRCEIPGVTGYKHYGARGISVCPSWSQSYAAFLKDMGRRPSPKHSIDRINNDGNYEPGNCRWATFGEQARNRRTSRRVERSDGTVFRTIRDAANSVGADPSTIAEACRVGRVSFGWKWRFADEP